MMIDSPTYKLVAEPSAPVLPCKGSSFIDPHFDTTLVRVTDASDGTINRISYGIWPALSCDYTKILIQCDGIFKIVTWNPQTMDGWGEIKLSPSFQGADAIWSHSLPNCIFHRDGGSRLMLLDVSTGEDAVIHDFASDFPDSPNLARMSASADDNVFCFARQTVAYAFSGFCVFTRSTGVIYREPPSRAGQYFKVQIDKSGRYMWNVALDPLSEWWDLSLPNTQQTVTSPGTGHSAVLTGKIAQYDNSTNADTLKPFGATGPTMIKWPDWNLATEYSGTESDEGWYAVTTGTLTPIGPLHDELLQVATDGSGTVRRICHLHNVLVSGNYDSIPQPSGGYGSQPWIAFHSSWGASGRRDVFLARTGPSNAPTPPAPAPAPVQARPVIGGVQVVIFLSLYGTGLAGSASATVGGLPAVVTYDSAAQLNVAVPAALIGRGATQIVVTVNGVASAPVSVTV
jgi:hypothetical protein